MDSKHLAFVEELQTLLTKYDARIEFVFDDSTDTHAIKGEAIVVSYRIAPPSYKEETYILSKAYDVTGHECILLQKRK